MTILLTESLDAEILRAAQEAKAPFPTYACETVAQQARIDPQSFVSDLDTYFYDIWSPGNGVKNCLKNPTPGCATSRHIWSRTSSLGTRSMLPWKH